MVMRTLKRFPFQLVKRLRNVTWVVARSTTSPYVTLGLADQLACLVSLQ
jgi:hypothetical protein